MKQLKDCVLKCRVFLIGIFPSYYAKNIRGAHEYKTSEVCC